MLLEAVVNLIAKSHPGATLSGVAFDPESERTWMPDLVWHERVANATSRTMMGRARQAMSLIIGILLATSRVFWPLRLLLPKEQCSAVEALATCDLAISAPGGYLQDSNQAYFLNLLQITIARSLCKRVILAPQSIGPIHSSIGQRLTRYALSDIDDVFVRESWSSEFTHKLFVNSRQSKIPPIHESGDLAFWFDTRCNPSDEQEAARIGIVPGRKILGLTMVDWNFPESTNPAEAREKYLLAVCGLVDHIDSLGTHQIVAFNQVNGDLPILFELQRRRPSVLVDTGTRSASSLAALIGMSDVFVGTRFHSCVFALISAVPTCAISYLPKTSGIMKDLGQSEFVVDISTVRSTDLIANVDRFLSNRALHSAAVMSAVQQYREECGQFVTYLEQS